MNEDPETLFRRLLHLDDEDDVVSELREAGFWDSAEAWRPVGDNDNNRAIIGNQQEDAVSALAEKITNSIDAVLIKRCLEEGIRPNGPKAPSTMRLAIAQFFGGSNDESAGRTQFWGSDRLTRTEIDQIAGNIWLSTTGTKDQPSITVADRGEGQTPDDFPKTFMALVGFKTVDGRTESQKKNIPFVQGQFNMGSSGTYPFSSPKHGLQLLISRRNRLFLDESATDRDKGWGFTVVRRNTSLQSKGSVYEYLAPVGAGTKFGEVLSFTADSLPLLPESPPTNVPNQIYSTEVSYGTLLKLYQYRYKETKLYHSHILRKDGLMRQLELVLPEAGLPIRLVEGRAYGGKPGSFQNNLFGIVNRLQLHSDNAAVDDDSDDLDSEDGDGKSRLTLEAPAVVGEINLEGASLPWTAYVFRQDAGDRTRSRQYNLILHVNGQKHAHRDGRFFSNKGLPYLAKMNTILCIVDCTNLSALQREEIFKPSRDRLNKGQLSNQLLELLGDALRENATLKELQNRQHAREQAERLNRKAPVRNVLKELLRTTPMLARFFQLGSAYQAPKPFPGKGSGSGPGDSGFVGRKHPTFLRFAKNGDVKLSRDAFSGSMVRILLETDADDDYLSRPRDSGQFAVRYTESSRPVSGTRGDLHGGALTYSLRLPEDVSHGDKLLIEFSVTDDVQDTDLRCSLELTVKPPAENSPGGGGTRRTGNQGPGRRGDKANIADLDIERCVQDPTERPDCSRWRDGWDESTAVEVIPNPTGGLTYYVNVENRYLMDYQKQNIGSDPALVEAKFLWAMVLLSLSIVEDYRRKTEGKGKGRSQLDEEEGDLISERDQLILDTTRAIAQLLLPMMEAVGAMTSKIVDEEDD